MIDVIRAEWQKMVGNRWTTGFLIWIFPVGTLALVIGLSLIALLSPGFRNNMSPLLWTDSFMVSWNFANNLFGRTFLLGFTAVTFAGEYQWGTWKNIVPRQRRAQLVLAKFINLTALIFISFTLMSLIFGFGNGVLYRVADVAYGPEVTDDVIQKFLHDYTLQAILAFVSIMIASIYAALSALLTQSILGGVMVGIGISVAEPLLIPGGLSLARLFDTAFFIHLGRFSPFYSIANIDSWVRDGKAISWLASAFKMFDETAPVDNLSFSLLVLMVWLFVGVGLVLILFQRQDITT